MTDDEFRAWLARDNEERCVLAELDYIDEVDDEPVLKTLYFSDRVFFDVVTDAVFVDVIRSAPQYSRALSGERLGSYVSSIDSLELDNADGQLDFLLNVACDGSPIRFKYGEPTWPLADFKLIFSAIAAKVSAPAFDRISVALKDTGLLLDKRIGGTAWIGAGTNADRIRPGNFGVVHNIEPLLADPALLKYVHSDVDSIAVATAARDRGASVAFTDIGLGVLQLSAAPDGQVTCDVLAEPEGSGNVAVSDAMDHFIGIRAGLSALSLYAGAGPTFDLHDDDDYSLGVSLPESRNAIDLLDALCDSGNCFPAIKRTGEFTFGRLRLNDIASFGLDERPIVEDDIVPGSSFRLEHSTPQYYKYQAYMSRNWKPQTDFASSLLPDEQAVYRRPGLYLLQPDSVGTGYLDAPELYHKTMTISPVVDTLLSEEFSPTDLDSLAQWMTTRRAVHLPWIEVITIVVGIEFFELELGDPVLLTTSRFGQDAGVLFQVISNVIRLTDARIELRLARRTVIQAVPDSWNRIVSAEDDSQQEYGRGPDPTDDIPIEVPAISDFIPGMRGGGGGGGGAGGGGGTRRWVPERVVRKIRDKIPAPLHPDVLLYVTMLGGDYTDHSIYAHTATPTNFSASGDLMVVSHSVTGTNADFKVAYSSPGGHSCFNYTGTDSFTIEGFMRVHTTENNTMPGVIFNWQRGAGPSSFANYRFALNAGTPNCKIKYFLSSNLAGPSSSSLPVATLVHWAWTYDGSANAHKWYIGGVQYMSLSSDNFAAKTDSKGFAEIGGQCSLSGAGTNLYYIGETRMTKRLLYASAFTPPTPYNLPPVT